MHILVSLLGVLGMAIVILWRIQQAAYLCAKLQTSHAAPSAYSGAGNGDTKPMPVLLISLKTHASQPAY